jgi:23S rRNA (cytidine1920-2'-O)/16S rRNA (cytidine1409-2'-O)-methyltransferase
MKSKKRLDLLLVEKGLVVTQKEAAALIMAGKVFSENRCLNKPGEMFANNLHIELKHIKEHNWVSRGGIKLDHGLKHFGINVSNKIALDIGCSTGGFTDVLLTNGAKKVYAIDVGYGELDWKLRNNERVILHERTNAKHLTTDLIPDPVEIIVCDASFISLKTILPASLKLASKQAVLIALIKPQFEAKKNEVGENGIITNPVIHQKVCNDIHNWISLQNWNVIGITESPIKGREGNTEFLIGATNG